MTHAGAERSRRAPHHYQHSTPPAIASDRPDHRTYAVVRYARAFSGEGPGDELHVLGTVRATTRAEAKARAQWPGEPATALRLRRASACRPALLLEALAADGARARASGPSSLRAPRPDGP